MKKLTVIVKSKDYDFQMDIKNPEIVKQFEEDPSNLILCVQGSISGAIGYIALPEETRLTLDLLERDYIKRKLELIKSLR